MGEAYSTRVSSDKCIQNFSLETEQNDLDVDERMILKRSLNCVRLWTGLTILDRDQ